MGTTKRGWELAGKLGLLDGRNGQQELVEACSALCRMQATYHRLMEYACNGDPAEARADRLEARMLATVAKLGDGFKLDLDGDPRGACVCIQTPDKRSNVWDRDRGIAV